LWIRHNYLVKKFVISTNEVVVRNFKLLIPRANAKCVWKKIVSKRRNYVNERNQSYRKKRKNILLLHEYTLSFIDLFFFRKSVYLYIVWI
jgi:hypothetical protein